MIESINWHAVADVGGWIGAAALLVAYALNVRGVLDSSSRIYNGLNLGAAIGLCIIALLKTNYQVVVIEHFWGAIALMGLIRPKKKT